MEKRTQESESLGYNEIYWYINTYFCKNLLFWKVMFFLKDLCAESADSQFDAAWTSSHASMLPSYKVHLRHDMHDR